MRCSAYFSLSKLNIEHWEASEKILKYLKATPGHALFYTSITVPTLSIFSDVDCPDTRRSMTGYCLFLGKLRSNTPFQDHQEAENRAMTQATCEIVWAIALLKDFGVKIEKAVIIKPRCTSV